MCRALVIDDNRQTAEALVQMLDEESLDIEGGMSCWRVMDCPWAGDITGSFRQFRPVLFDKKA